MRPGAPKWATSPAPVLRADSVNFHSVRSGKAVGAGKADANPVLAAVKAATILRQAMPP
jgi:hypothetical protein